MPRSQDKPCCCARMQTGGNNSSSKGPRLGARAHCDALNIMTGHPAMGCDQLQTDTCCVAEDSLGMVADWGNQDPPSGQIVGLQVVSAALTEICETLE
jgi:hypothetical protein